VRRPHRCILHSVYRSCTLTFVYVLLCSIIRPRRVSPASLHHPFTSPVELLSTERTRSRRSATRSPPQPALSFTARPLVSPPPTRPTHSRRAAAPPRPSSARAAGAGGSSNTMLKLYTDSGEAGLKVYVDVSPSRVLAPKIPQLLLVLTLRVTPTLLYPCSKKQELERE
jgi:hypothetical protein